MEASPCFLTCKAFTKTSSATLPFFHKKRPGQVFPGRVASPSVTYCSLRSDQDDGGEAVIKSDWRSFRARLVAGEQATSVDRGLTPLPPPAVALGDKWAHLIHEPERGCLLLATDKLDGVHIFERTVILLLSVGPLGPTGVILNRPSLMSIKETPSLNLDVAGVFSDRPLFFGGPLEEGLFLVGPRGGRNDDGTDRSGVFEEVMQGVYYGTKESVGCAAEMVKRDVVGVKDVRFFDGYCGWEREQLAEEIRAGFWRVVACSPKVVGEGEAGAGSAGLWEEVMGLVGESKVMD
ncbi:uncharacterized protein LOC141831175 [Curcuma longa]|uniref:uncharacterized protein LOC141831175 n=1 Tax=Curcuma longa TaxID=136217 RepID=UPI003D9EC759